MEKGQGHRGPQKGLGGFAQALSGLFVPKHVARAQEIEREKKEGQERYVEGRQRRGIVQIHQFRTKRGVTKRPAGTVRAENRRRNKAAKKMRRKQRA